MLSPAVTHDDALMNQYITYLVDFILYVLFLHWIEDL